MPVLSDTKCERETTTWAINFIMIYLWEWKFALTQYATNFHNLSIEPKNGVKILLIKVGLGIWTILLNLAHNLNWCKFDYANHFSAFICDIETTEVFCACWYTFMLSLIPMKCITHGFQFTCCYKFWEYSGYSFFTPLRLESCFMASEKVLILSFFFAKHFRIHFIFQICIIIQYIL